MVRPGDALSATLGRRVRDIRLERSISQVELANETGLGQAFLSRLETGRETNLHLGTLERLAEGLGVRLVVELHV